MRGLERAGQQGHRAEGVEAALERGLLLGPQPQAGIHALVEAGPALVHRNLVRPELLGQKAPAEADIEAAVRQVVQHGELAGQFDRVAERGKHRTGDQPHPGGAAAAAARKVTGSGL